MKTLGCLAETRASWNSREQWLWETNQTLGGYSSMLNVLQDRFVEIQLYIPRFFISIKWENFLEFVKFWVTFRFSSALWIFNICISNSVWYFLFQWSKYMEELIGLFSSYFCCFMDRPLLHWHWSCYLTKARSRWSSFSWWLSSHHLSFLFYTFMFSMWIHLFG